MLYQCICDFHIESSQCGAQCSACEITSPCTHRSSHQLVKFLRFRQVKRWKFGVVACTACLKVSPEAIEATFLCQMLPSCYSLSGSLQESSLQHSLSSLALGITCSTDSRHQRDGPRSHKAYVWGTAAYWQMVPSAWVEDDSWLAQRKKLPQDVAACFSCKLGLDRVLAKGCYLTCTQGF